jgi:hypothetical protein
MRFSSLQKNSAAVVLGIVLMTAMPAPAHADVWSSILSAVTNVAKILTSGFSSLLTGLQTGFGQNVATTAATGRLQTATDIQRTDHTVQEIERQARQGALAQASLLNQPADDATCQFAANNKNAPALDVAVKVSVEDAVENVVLAQSYIHPNSGDARGIQMITDCLCQLGATGENKAGCKTPGDTANALVGGDWSIGVAVLGHFCIPMDTRRVLNEIQSCMNNRTYTQSDTNLKKAMVAILSIRVNRQLTLGRALHGRETENIPGVTAIGLMDENVSLVSASNRPILKALGYNSCPAKTQLQGCDQDELGLRDILKRAYPTLALPDANYCLSKNLRRLAENQKDVEDMMTMPFGGTAIQQHQLAVDLQARIDARDAKFEMLMDAAASAAGERPSRDDIIAPRGDRAIGAENDMKELLQSIRKLTRALEQTGQKLPRALEVKAQPPEGDVRPGNAAALPPLRQEFETLQ